MTVFVSWRPFLHLTIGARLSRLLNPWLHCRQAGDELTGLAMELEHTDPPPTSLQRKRLDYERLRFDRTGNGWKGLRVDFPWFAEQTRMGEF